MLRPAIDRIRFPDPQRASYARIPRILHDDQRFLPVCGIRNVRFVVPFRQSAGRRVFPLTALQKERDDLYPGLKDLPEDGEGLCLSGLDSGPFRITVPLFLVEAEIVDDQDRPDRLRVRIAISEPPRSAGPPSRNRYRRSWRLTGEGTSFPSSAGSRLSLFSGFPRRDVPGVEITDNGFGGFGIVIGGDDDGRTRKIGQFCEQGPPERINPRMVQVAIDKAGSGRRDLGHGCAGRKAERLDPLRHDPLVADCRCASLDPGRIDDFFPENLRGRDAEGRKGRFPQAPA